MARKRAFIPPIERVRDGFAFNIGDDERRLVARLLTELSQLLMGEADDPRLIRIFPPAYHLADDADADAEYQRLMREELVASRPDGHLHRQRRVGVAGCCRRRDDDRVRAGDQRAASGARNHARRQRGPEADDIDDDDPLAGEHHLYNFLSWLLDWAVRALGEPVNQRET